MRTCAASIVRAAGGGEEHDAVARERATRSNLRTSDAVKTTPGIIVRMSMGMKELGLDGQDRIRPFA